MEPLSSSQVQYTVPSIGTCRVLCRGWNLSQAYRYSTLFPPSEHTGSCAEDGTSLKLTGTVHCSLPLNTQGPVQRMNLSQAYRYSTLFPPSEHAGSCAEDGTSLKLTGTVHCSLPLNMQGPVQRMEPLSSLQVQYTVPSL